MASPALTLSPGDAFAYPPIDFDLSLTTDDASAVVGSIGPEGGQLSATTADGTTYTLEVPPGALLFDEAITITPIVAATGLPGDPPPEHTAGVRLEPDGLELLAPATLHISAPEPLPEDGVATFGFYGDGENAGSMLFDQAASEISVSLAHFSGYASFWPVDEGWWERLLRLRQAAVDKDFRDTIGTIVNQERQNQKFGLGEENFDALLENLGKGFDRWILNPLLERAPLGCLEAQAAIGAYLAWNRQMQLLGVTLEGLSAEDYNRATQAQRDLDAKLRRHPPVQLFALAFDLCAEEKFQRCVAFGDFETLRGWLMGYMRQQELLGNEIPPSVITRAWDYLERCGHWKLTLESTEVSQLPRINMRTSLYQRRTYEIKWQHGDLANNYGMLGPIGTGDGETEILAFSAHTASCKKMLFEYQGTDPPDRAGILRLPFQAGAAFETEQWVAVKDRGDGRPVLVQVRTRTENDPRPLTVDLGFTFGDQSWRFIDTRACFTFTTADLFGQPAGRPLSDILQDEMRRRKDNWRFETAPYSAELTLTKSFPTTDPSTGIVFRNDVEAILTLLHTP